MPNRYIVKAVKFIAISALSFHTKEMYIHPIVGSTAIYKFAGYMFPAVSIMLNMISNELIHFIQFSICSPFNYYYLYIAFFALSTNCPKKSVSFFVGAPLPLIGL